MSDRNNDDCTSAPQRASDCSGVSVKDAPNALITDSCPLDCEVRRSLEQARLNDLVEAVKELTPEDAYTLATWWPY